MPNANYAPVCGLYCKSCDFLGVECEGCGYVDGRPFWAKQMPAGICPIHDCCRNKKQLEHCGLCQELPCTTFLELRDPNMSNEEFQKSLDERIEALQRRTKIGTDEWLRAQSSN